MSQNRKGYNISNILETLAPYFIAPPLREPAPGGYIITQ